MNNDELPNMFSSTNIITMIGSGRMRKQGSGVHMEVARNTCRTLVAKRGGKMGRRRREANTEINLKDTEWSYAD
jgi:hypothetical protein